ncbi:unnamed protein product [Strongylus vulgaris]|uniref:Uncharacterized protein n=1 Tax=Strongylus vulgaris TaxID=40348 RepID=A0A3P7JBX4_STRVU|nr:unnamed protein product [Strongylus vulgaris]
MFLLLDGSKLRSKCISCSLEEHQDAHTTTDAVLSRCCGQPCQATRFGLCEKCLKKAHEENFGDAELRAGGCVLLCSNRQGVPHSETTPLKEDHVNVL